MVLFVTKHQGLLVVLHPYLMSLTRIIVIKLTGIELKAQIGQELRNNG